MILIILVIITLSAVGYWHCKRRQLQDQRHSFPTHSSRHKLADDPHIEKSNNENEEKLWRYHNPLKVTSYMSSMEQSNEPSCSLVVPQGPGDPKLTSLGLLPTANVILTSPETDLSDMDSPAHHAGIPHAIRKVQNADVERNITPHEVTSKSLQKEMNLKGLPLSVKSFEKDPSTN